MPSTAILSDSVTATYQEIPAAGPQPLHAGWRGWQRRLALAPPDTVDELALGVDFPGLDRSIARQVALAAGVPADRTAYTVDRACCSSLTATALAARSLRCGDARLAVAGGAENLSGVPYAVPGLRFGTRLALSTVYGSPTVTAGNAPNLSSGAAA